MLSTSTSSIENNFQNPHTMNYHQVFKDVRNKMNDGINYEEILDYLFDSLDMAIPYDRIGIALLENNNKNFKLGWAKCKEPIVHLKVNYVGNVEGTSLQEMIRTRSPRIINDLKAYFIENPHSISIFNAIEDGLRSSLTYPLFVNGKTIGFIFFSSFKEDTYKELHIDYFSEISEEISLIVEQGLIRKILAEAQEKDKLFRNTIHELNNPLGVIRIALDLITMEDWFSNLNTEAKSIFQILSRKNEAMITLVKDLTFINQLRGPLQLEIAPYELESFLKDITISAEMMTLRKSINLEIIKPTSGPQYIYIDPMRIMQAVENLVSNAINYSEPDTTIVIEIIINQDHSTLTFKLTDQGQGIPADEMSRLFEEFGKTSVRPTRGESSSGLGLSIVKSIIEAHKGYVSASSEYGKGSVFCFSIPIS